MTTYHKIAIGAVGVVLLAGIGFLASLAAPRPVPVPAPVTPSPEVVTIRGEIVCLPHRDTTGPVTLECAYGMRDEQGAHFALRDSDPSYRNIGSAPMGQPVYVMGTLMRGEDERYQSEGVIEVTSIIPIAQPAPAPSSSNGTVSGAVTLGPNCPVFQDPPDPQCADRPFQTSLALLAADGTGGARTVTTFASDANGRFSLTVAPGTYTIGTPPELMRPLPACGPTGQFTVRSNERVTVNVSCDTGIR